MRIFLIGFMGSGKSFIGRKLAKLNSSSFIDLDNEIEVQQGRKIRQIFEEDGEAAFREMERVALHKMNQHPNAIIATGGGTPCFFDNMDWMNRQGITIYLQTPIEILLERLQPERSHRPLLQDLSDEALHAFISEKLAMRESFYLRASIVYQITQANEDVAEALMQYFSNITGH
ncbi:MAG: shikimate kinase [Saprospiraceae bacterium]|nr:shikimate kinase [Saprospiraceae bacterium]